MSFSASPCLLLVDTATEVVHLALVAQGQVHVRAVAGGAQASSSTLPQMQALLAEAGLAWGQLDAIGFGQGPGAFTGLRTACSITQGLALALDKPVLAVDTLMAVAESARSRQPGVAQALTEGAELWVLQDARMREVYAAPYRYTAATDTGTGSDAGAGHGQQGGWQALAAPQLWPIEHARAMIAAGHVHCAAGSALRAYAEELPVVSGPVDDQAQPGGHALATLALAAWRRGEVLDAALALPLYVRDKVAQTTEERVAARRSAQEAAPSP